MQVNFFNVIVWLRSIKYKIYLPFESNQIEENSYFQLTLKVYANKCIQIQSRLISSCIKQLVLIKWTNSLLSVTKNYDAPHCYWWADSKTPNFIETNLARRENDITKWPGMAFKPLWPKIKATDSIWILKKFSG